MFTNLVSTFVPPSEESFLKTNFYGAWETLLGRGLVCGRWLSVLCQWNGGGSLIRQTTQRAWMLIALCGAVWQQACWRGTSHRGYIHTAHIFTTLHIYQYRDYFTVTCSIFGSAAGGRGKHVSSSFLFFCCCLFCSWWVISYPPSSGWHSEAT